MNRLAMTLVPPPLLAGAVLVLALSTTGCSCENSNDQPCEVAPAKTVASQKEAVALARYADIPALDNADCVVISCGEDRVTVTDLKRILALKKALAVEAVPPSGGETWATVEWFRGDAPLRAVWVYEYGEWGFVRPGVSYTTGRSDSIAGVIRLILDKRTGVDK